MTFRRKAARQIPPPHKSCIAGGEVELTAEINDLELWDQVVTQLECFRVYTVKNLAQQMVAVSQKKLVELQEEIEQAQVKANDELEKLRQRISFLEHENRQLREANKQWAAYSVQASTIPKVPDGG